MIDYVSGGNHSEGGWQDSTPESARHARQACVYYVFVDAVMSLFVEEDKVGMALSRIQEFDMTGVWTHEGIVARQMYPLRHLNFVKKSESYKNVTFILFRLYL